MWTCILYCLARIFVFVKEIYPKLCIASVWGIVFSNGNNYFLTMSGFLKTIGETFLFLGMCIFSITIKLFRLIFDGLQDGFTSLYDFLIREAYNILIFQNMFLNNKYTKIRKIQVVLFIWLDLISIWDMEKNQIACEATNTLAILLVHLIQIISRFYFYIMEKVLSIQYGFSFFQKETKICSIYLMYINCPTNFIFSLIRDTCRIFHGIHGSYISISSARVFPKILLYGLVIYAELVQLLLKNALANKRFLGKFLLGQGLLETKPHFVDLQPFSILK
ncbi:hypothetical protein ACJX0J_031279 [Zea mays]